MSRYRKGEIAPIVTLAPGFVIWIPVSDKSREIPEEIWEAALEAPWCHVQDKDRGEKSITNTGAGNNIIRKIMVVVAKMIGWVGMKI